MAQEPRKHADPAEDDVEKFLTEQKQVEIKRQDLIKDLLRQKAAAVEAFDEKLAKLGHTGETKRNHHKNKPKKAPASSGS
jgi:hypothetical protein